MLPHAGQGANQAIEDGVALAAVLARADRASAPRALQIYETLRCEHTAGVQRKSRSNGAKFDAVSGDLALRDRSLADPVQGARLDLELRRRGESAHGRGGAVRGTVAAPVLTGKAPLSAACQRP